MLLDRLLYVPAISLNMKRTSYRQFLERTIKGVKLRVGEEMQLMVVSRALVCAALSSSEQKEVSVFYDMASGCNS